MFTKNDEERLVKEYTWLVVRVASKFRESKVLSIEDYIQHGYIGLLKAIKSFDNRPECSFATFASKCIYNEIHRFFHKTKVDKISLNVDIPCVLGNEIWEYIPSDISDFDFKILNLRIQGMSYREIAKELSSERRLIRRRYLSLLERLKSLHDDEQT